MNGLECKFYMAADKENLTHGRDAALRRPRRVQRRNPRCRMFHRVCSRPLYGR
jgi:hypothetical protein